MKSKNSKTSCIDRTLLHFQKLLNFTIFSTLRVITRDSFSYGSCCIMMGIEILIKTRKSWLVWINKFEQIRLVFYNISLFLNLIIDSFQFIHFCFVIFLWFLSINDFMHVAGIFIDENDIFIDENTYSCASSGMPHDKASSPYLHFANVILY